MVTATWSMIVSTMEGPWYLSVTLHINPCADPRGGRMACHLNMVPYPGGTFGGRSGGLKPTDTIHVVSGFALVTDTIHYGRGGDSVSMGKSVNFACPDFFFYLSTPDSSKRG